jgi:PAS domain S-box-containing protein
VGQHFSRFYPPEAIKSGHPENELRIARALGKYEDEGWRVRGDCTLFWATVLITAVHDKDGKLRGFSKLTRDTTERKRTEERFQRVVEAAPSAMIMVGADGLMTLVNNQTEKLFGYHRTELLGQNIEMLIPARFRANHGGQLATFFAAPVVRAMGAGRDLFGVRKDGREVPIEIGLSPIVTAIRAGLGHRHHGTQALRGGVAIEIRRDGKIHLHGVPRSQEPAHHHQELYLHDRSGTRGRKYGPDPGGPAAGLEGRRQDEDTTR